MFQVVDRPKLYEQVVEQIKNMIVQGIYKKGDLLPSEKELIEMIAGAGEQDEEASGNA